MKLIKKNDLFINFLKKVQKGPDPGYTMIIRSWESSPLHGLAKDFKRLYPEKKVHSDIFISKITDPAGIMIRISPKLWIEIETVIRLLPDTVLNILLDDRLKIILNDGIGSYYDPLSSKISIKGVQDFIHETGHHIWNTWLIKADEENKRKAVNNSSTKNADTRKQLPYELIPDNHKKYAELIGAWSGQFIINPESVKISNRKNDLEEHFARNLDLFMRGRPLDITVSSKAGLNELTEFYRNMEISSNKHVSLYKYLLKKLYGKTNPNIIEPEKAVDGILITRDELFQYHLNRITFETGKKLDAASQIALALDLTKIFVDFCLSQKALDELGEALDQKGITVIDHHLKSK